MRPEAEQSRTDFLRSVALFGALDDLSLERIDAMLVAHAFPPGAIVCKEGEHGRSMYVVASGEVEVRRANSNGDQVPIVRLGPGEFFGEMTLIEIQPRSATVVVTEPATLYALSNKDLYTLYQEDQNAYLLVLQNICRQLARRLRKADSQICELLSSAGDPPGLVRHPSLGAVGTGSRAE
jgi:CRP-like cAMP-binding protein